MGRRSKRPEAVPRLRARRKKSGKLYYYYDHGGEPRREEALGADYGLAIIKWAEYERTRTASEIVARSITFRFVAEQYIAHVIPTKAPRTQDDNLKEMAKLLEFFDDPPGPLDAVEPQNVKQYMQWRVKPRVHKSKKGKPVKSLGTGKVRANREKALLSHMWNWARGEGYTALANPCTGIKGNSEKAREIYVDDDELKSVRDKGDATLQDALDLAYLTGQRPSDTRAMDQRHIKQDALEVKQGKTGKKLRIAVEGELKELLDRIAVRKRTYPVHSTRLIVDDEGQPLTEAQLRYRFNKARILAGVTFQFRDIRAKAGTDTTDTTGDIRQAQKQLGHSSITQTEDYIRQRRGDKVKPTKRGTIEG